MIIKYFIIYLIYEFKVIIISAKSKLYYNEHDNKQIKIFTSKSFKEFFC
jgi:hypothetical protein